MEVAVLPLPFTANVVHLICTPMSWFSIAVGISTHTYFFSSILFSCLLLSLYFFCLCQGCDIIYRYIFSYSSLLQICTKDIFAGCLKLFFSKSNYATRFCRKQSLFSFFSFSLCNRFAHCLSSSPERELSFVDELGDVLS